MEVSTKTLAPWLGSNRILAPIVGAELGDCEWAGVPFAGGMCEIGQIKARTILVSDLHRHVINLARVVQSETLRPALIKQLRGMFFHPDELDQNQEWCKAYQPVEELKGDLQAAYAYFICCWMGRSHIAGTRDEFHGKLSTRWNANGGDSNVRYRSAIRALAEFGRIGRRCSFSVLDAFDFLPRCEDKAKHGLYVDPPFPGAGRKYRHNSGRTEVEEKQWHTALRNELARFERTRVVIRFYDHPLVRELYSASKWTWVHLKGRKQSNEAAPEVLLINGPSHTQKQATMF
jgi:hypothetical protein